jgi:hypothetical protein
LTHLSGQRGASLAVLRLAVRITLLEAYTSQQVILTAKRNLAIRLPKVLPAFRLIGARCHTAIACCERAICQRTWYYSIRTWITNSI